MATDTMAVQRAGSGPSLIKILAERYGVEPGKFYGMVKTVIFPSTEKFQATDEMIMAFLTVCHEYELNPILREIYPFVDKNGNLRVIVGIDGWIKVVQRNPKYDGHTFKPHQDSDGRLVAVTCQMWRTDRTKPIEMTEYMHECKRDTEPWNKWPSRMLHHKAYIQTARYAFGMNAFIDEDEADRLTAIDVQHRPIDEPKRLSEGGNSSPRPQLVDEPRPTPTTTSEAAGSPSAEHSQQHRAEPDGPADEADIKRVWSTAFPKSLSKTDVNAMAKKKFNVERVQALAKSQVEQLIGDIQAL